MNNRPVTIFAVPLGDDPIARGKAVLQVMRNALPDFEARVWLGDQVGLAAFPNSAFAAVVAVDGHAYDVGKQLAPFEPRIERARAYEVMDWNWPREDGADEIAQYGEAIPGVSMLSFTAAREDLVGDPAEVIRRWRLHIPVAHRVHYRMVRYIQYELIDGLAGTPPYFGMAYLHYRTSEAMLAEGERPVEDTEFLMNDVSRFVNYPECRPVWGTEYGFARK